MQDLVLEETAANELRDFLRLEYVYVNDHIELIHDTRDRFFGNFMTVSLGVFGLLGFLLQQSQEVESRTQSIAPFQLIMTVALGLFGLATLFLITNNWIARDYYRQRRSRLQRLLMLESGRDALRDAVAAYTRFSRDQATWHLRLTSIYFIYSVCVAVANASAVGLVAYRLANLLPSTILGLGILLVLLQLLAPFLYGKIYRRTVYPEG